MVLAEILVAHQDRAVVRVGDAYIKVETDQTKAEREHAVLCAAPVPVPEVLWWRPGSPSLLALARVEGAALSGSTAREDWMATGRAVRALHEAPRPDWGAMVAARDRPALARR